MAKVINIRDWVEEREPHATVETDAGVHVVPEVLVEGIASGELSIAEFENPEETGKILAVMALGVFHELD